MEIRQLPGRFFGVGLIYLINESLSDQYQTTTQIMVRILRNENPAIHPTELSADVRDNLRTRIESRLKIMGRDLPEIEVKVFSPDNSHVPTRYVRKIEI